MLDVEFGAAENVHLVESRNEQINVGCSLERSNNKKRWNSQIGGGLFILVFPQTGSTTTRTKSSSNPSCLLKNNNPSRV